MTEANSSLIKPTLLAHIYGRIIKLEKACNGVVALQFSTHPNGLLGMVIRIYLPQSGKEYSYNDMISKQEMMESIIQNERIDVLFDSIHDALEKVQPISSMSGGLIHH